jgi:pantoate--beta-alanine ligase
MNQVLFSFKKKTDCRRFLNQQRTEHKSIGFVPTMGALHEGHLSLIRQSKKETDITVCSIFVNPTQFNDPHDLEKYPRTIEPDIELLAEADCNVLFLPDEKEIYPEGTGSLKKYDLGNLESMLEGISRPGHFQGVANVVDRLLEIVQPDRLYMGQKDFQQIKVIEKMIQQSAVKPQVIVCPIIRELSGLAMSSRNVRLTSEQRKNAAKIYSELQFIRDHFLNHSFHELKSQAISDLNSIPEMKADYLEFCDAENFRTIENRDEARHIVCLAAVYVGGVRLIDNILLK